MDKTVIELFAGVGGFRVGLNHIKSFKENGQAIEDGPFTFVWANQWEPSTKEQHAFNCYNYHFNESNNSNLDISLVNKKEIPDHTLLCGGFPCQDYSVAHTLSKSKGIEGKKGVLWWQINEILQEKKPSFVLLENVDRLVKSPAKQRGRDFGIMLRCFNDLGYGVSWKIINAAEYGFAQRRRRIYIFAYHKSTNYYKNLSKNKLEKILIKESIFAQEFPCKNAEAKLNEGTINHFTDLVELSDNYKFDFKKDGIMLKGNILTSDLEPVQKDPILLKDIVLKENIDKSFFLTNEQIKKFEYLRGSKKIPRTRPNGESYFYTEGSMSPYDDLNLPARTMLTSEGSINRSTHIIKDIKTDKLRLITPLECERINGFPDNWTEKNMSTKRRYFIMGNALVCGIIEKIGDEISNIIDEENRE